MDDPVVCVKAWDDWYTLERESGRRLAWASVEGSAAEMRALATAILAGEGYAAKRCAVELVSGARGGGGGWSVWSPRNHASDTYPRITPAEARGLAEQILRDVPTTEET